MTTSALFAELQRDEGCRLRAYQDSRGIWTIGYGHARCRPGEVWTPGQALAQLHLDIEATEEALDGALPWWRELDAVRQDALANMAFNLGVEGLLGFGRMLAALKAGDVADASAQMLASRWAAQVGERAQRLAQMIATGARAP